MLQAITEKDVAKLFPKIEITMMPNLILIARFGTSSLVIPCVYSGTQKNQYIGAEVRLASPRFKADALIKWG